ncbi:hypothetical protein ES332_A03G225100v1 [Gossypium tomentosum]|uniref:Uncharacterized protein n=1 Tax=Gossypium tomentosum TaxID=34277 RepID=A0A5D2RAV6_GOSTO|nr:hypothetical protein ES332_A03G225100v1 [Gossypium tomentosum]
MKVFEINGNTLSLALFIDVTNSKELKESMKAGKLNPEALIPVHSKLVYNYLVSKYITESLKRCGISDDLSYVLDLMLLVMSWYHIIYIHVLLVAIHYFYLRLYPAYSTLMLH